MTRCCALRTDGTPCQGVASTGEELCAFHNPANTDQRAAGRREGGRQRSQPRATLPADHPEVQVRSAREVCGLLSDTINQVRTGRLDPKIANTVGYLAGILIRSFEVGQLEERLAALKEAVRPTGGIATSEFDRVLPSWEEEA